ncbi:MAG: DUF1730 domain-containing protein [Lentisphaerae bacterium]|nr:MAG: DUF1730 domain-containing protein [Lentisphaerota bacterium]
MTGRFDAHLIIVAETPERFSSVPREYFIQCQKLKTVTTQLSAQQLIHLCREAGFDDAGCTTPEIPEQVQRHALAISRAGFFDELPYLQRHLHDGVSPATVLSGVNTVIVTVLHYNLPASATAPAGSPAIARYACFRDYHRVFKRLHRNVLKKLSAMGAQARAFSDTTPFSERTFAIKARLGNLMRNGMFCHHRFGPRVFLGCILTDLRCDDLPESTPDASVLHPHCHNCDACIRHCPTGALRHGLPPAVDTRRCLSSLTIENRGPVPASLQEKIRYQLFGCDRCLDVCPIQDAYQSEEFPMQSPLFPPRLPQAWDPVQFLAECIDDERFRQRFDGTVLRRPGQWGLIRNALIVCTNLHLSAAVPLIETLLQRNDLPHWLRHLAVASLAELS